MRRDAWLVRPLVLFTAALLLMAGTGFTQDTNLHGFAIYSVKPMQGRELEVDLDELALDPRPLITEADVAAYNWRAHVFWLTALSPFSGSTITKG